MSRQRTPGLTKRSSVWHIDKRVHGRRLCESTGTSDIKEAERYLAKRSEEIRKATLYGERPQRTFRQAATKYLLENQQKASIWRDALCIQQLDSFIGHLPLAAVHMESLQGYIQARRKEGVKARTI